MPEDISLYDKLGKKVLSDLDTIRAISNRLTYADTTFLPINSYYLYKIDSNSYAPLITELKKRNIYLDDIAVTPDSVICFCIKESIDDRELPHYSYFHALVYNASSDFNFPWDEEVLKDSIINGKWRYIYYKVQVGH